MGTPDFAVPSLEILLKCGYEIVGVVTAPDKPKGRGQRIAGSPVKAFALQHNLRVLQPDNLRAPEFITALRGLDANLQVVVAFRMLPEMVWSAPRFGTFNLHASLLPQYRGAAPIHWAIINGERETGVTTFFLQHEIDTGRIIFQECEPIRDSDNAGSLHNRLMMKGAALVLKTVQAIESGDAPSIPQVTTGSALKTAPKIFKEHCQINWNAPATAIINLVRGLSPSPAAWTIFGGSTFKIFEAATATGTIGQSPGTLSSDGKHYLNVKATDGWVSVLALQPEAGRRMSVSEYLAGHQIAG